MKLFKDKTILITGGTGSFGKKFAHKLILEGNFKKLIIASRDEKKQHDMRLTLGDKNIVYKIANVRDKDRINNIMKNVDLVFHAAALKHVPSCEYDPFEAVKTNIIGSNNVLTSALENNVERVVCLSTDKAVYPINAMGISKAMMERLIMSMGRETNNTIFNVVRYGNVISSRGSVIPLFLDRLLKKEEILITDKRMTRFLLSLNEAVELVEYALTYGLNGDIFVRKAPAASIMTILEACRILTSNNDNEFKTIGIREGEKLNEVLIAQEEFNRAEDQGDFYKISSSAKRSYFKFFKEGNSPTKDFIYASNTTNQLNVEQVLDLLKNNYEVNQILKNQK